MKFHHILVPALLVSTSAFAADLAVPEVPVEPAAVFSWTGAYVGVLGGYGWGDTQDTNNPAADKKEIDGGFGGFTVGYNYQFDNNIVLGVEGDIAFGSISNDWEDPNQFSGYFTEDKVEAMGTLRARLGYAVENFMIYGTGGLAIGKTKHVLGCDADLVDAGVGSCASNPAREFEDSGSDVAVGYSVGAGAEYAFTNNWTVKAEYLYTDLGTSEVTLSDPGFPAAIDDREFDTKFHAVRIGLNYKF